MFCYFISDSHAHCGFYTHNMSQFQMDHPVASGFHTGQHRFREGPPPTPTPMLDGLSSNCRVNSEILQKILNGKWDVFSCRDLLQDSDT